MLGYIADLDYKIYNPDEEQTNFLGLGLQSHGTCPATFLPSLMRQDVQESCKESNR